MAGPTHVGLIGVGTMGRGLARNLATKGHALRVFDRDPRACAEAEGFGARTSASLAETWKYNEPPASLAIPRLGNRAPR